MTQSEDLLLSDEQGKRIRTLTQNYLDGALTVDDWKRQITVVIREAETAEHISLDELLAEMEEEERDVYVSVVQVGQGGVHASEEFGRGVRFDYDQHGGIVGVEILGSYGVTQDGRDIPKKLVIEHEHLSDAFFSAESAGEGMDAVARLVAERAGMPIEIKEAE